MSDATTLEAYHFYEREWESYDELREAFEWEIPTRFNMAEYVCDRWADEKNRVAIFAETPAGETRTYTFWQLRRLTNQLANYLAEQGVERGDRVAVNVPQKAETAIAHIAIWKLGAVSVPLSILFGPDGLRYRLEDSSAVACLVDESNDDAFFSVEDDLDDLETVLTVGDVDSRHPDLWDAIADQPVSFEPVDTRADENAIIIYTSGTTGDPKGVLHAHRFLLGNLPCFVTTHSAMEVSDEDVYWMPMEWAWVGMFNMVFCPFFYGKPVVAYERESFEPETAFEIIERYGVTSFLSVPTGLRMMRDVDHVADDHDVSSLRVVPSGGEEASQDLIDWVDDTFDGAVLQKAYGQTEANIVVGECSAFKELEPDTLGVAAPGHEVSVVDRDTAEELEPGETGELAVRYEGNPVCFVEYWNQPEKTANKRENGWHRMEDLGWRDEAGHFGFVSRKDDVILCSGYRVGPDEVEESVQTHEAVAGCGVIGVPHEIRGEVPKAFVELADGWEPSAALEDELKQHVKDQLAKYEYPREIEFIDALPTTAINKLRRADLREREGLE